MRKRANPRRTSRNLERHAKYRWSWWSGVRLVFYSDDERRLKRMSISGVYQDQESAIKYLQELSKEYHHDWLSKRKKVGDYREKDFFEGFDAMKDGRPSM